MRRFILAPEAAHDLLEIWRYLNANAGLDVAENVERVIRDKIAFLSKSPGAGHRRRELTGEGVKFFAVYSYLIVYLPDTKPLQVVAILHGYRDIGKILAGRV